jgi:replicative DNA helicase
MGDAPTTERRLEWVQDRWRKALGGRQPPADWTAEQAVLGCLLRDSRGLDDVAHVLRADHFHTDAHRRIFLAILDLHAKGRRVDIVTVAERLKEADEVQDIGGYAYLADLALAGPTTAGVTEYVRIVTAEALRRELIYLAEETARRAATRETPEDVLQDAEARLFALAERGNAGEVVTLESVLAQVYDAIDARAADGGGRRLLTHYIDLDNLTGGFAPGELVILAARPSLGKTSLALNIVRRVLHQGRSVLFVSLEQSKAELAERLLCCEAKIDSHKLRRGLISAEEARHLVAAGNVLGATQLFIDDAACQSVLRVQSNARRLKRRHDLSLVVIDYLQLIEPERRGENRQVEVATVCRRLKMLAKDLGVPVLVLAQLNRQVEERTDQRPRLSDLRESGSIEQDADTVLLLHRPDEVGCENVINVNVAKQRNGPVGTFNLVFLKQYMRFENYAPDPVGMAG